MTKNEMFFSLCLDGTPACEVPHTVTTETDGDRETEIYDFGTLRITREETRFPAFGARMWKNTFENRGTAPSALVTGLFDGDVTLPLPHEEPRRWEAFFPDAATATKIYAPTGSTWGYREFYCEVDDMDDNRRLHHIYPGETQTYATSGGRSCEAHAPFFRVQKGKVGYLIAIGWTGQWRAEFCRTCDSIHLRTQIEDTAFRVLPGERFRTSSVLILPYADGEEEAHNRFRRLLRSLAPPAARELPLAAGVWGGMPSADVLARVNAIRHYRLPFTHIWMDAGWYGIDTAPTPNEFEGDWSTHTGDYRVSPKIHPAGLCDVSAAVHAAGMKFLLWFEPERIRRGTPLAAAHPEWLLPVPGDEENLLLNLGDPAAWTYCHTLLRESVARLSIDCYRQDFNIAPLAAFRAHDGDERRGMTEILHINGLYRLWDALLAEFPALLIDNCAAGGRRIDLETLRRSVPLWRSDMQCPANYDPDASQCHAGTFSLFLPYSGTGSGRLYDEYRIRSAYAPAMTTNYTFSLTETFGKSEEEIAFLHRYLAEYRRVQPYLCEDFYNLTAPSAQKDVFAAMQYHRPAVGDGVLLLYRRENAPYDSATFPLRGLCPDRLYRMTDADGGEWTECGATLLAGWQITIREKRKAKVIFYRPAEELPVCP